MYRVLIVDDEEIERSGMVNLIPWQDYEIEIIGDAWNGFEGYKIVKEKEPDIIITDIKMPGMDGIELIGKVQKDYPNIYFIVLSGYGEYEYTSKAMELGVKYYILKPCDEEKILKVVNQVKAEILKRKKHKRYEDKKYNEEIKKLLPRAREQFFNKVLSGTMVSQKEYMLFQNNEINTSKVRILNCRIDGEIDNLGKFILQNITEEFLGQENIIMSTYIDSEVVFMLKEMETDLVRNVILKLKIEYKIFCKKQILAALSDTGDFLRMKELYDQTKEMLLLSSYEYNSDLFISNGERFSEKKHFILEYDKFRQVDEYESLLFETNVLFAKFKLEHYGIKDMQNLTATFLNAIIKQELSSLMKEVHKQKTKERLYEYMVQKLYDSETFTMSRVKDFGKDRVRVQEMLLVIYHNIAQRNLSLQWLAKEVLFLNEEYFGRFFQKTMNKKFSTFIFEIRMEMAKRLIQYKPDILISELSELVGYTADGQYFSKVFKKFTTMTPTEYRELLTKQKFNKG